MSEVQETSEAVPRFGVRHVMLWTLCSGLQMVGAKWILARETALYLGMSSQPAAQHADLQIAVGAFTLGAVFAGACMLIWTWLRQQRPLLTAPGHWLVFSLSLISVYDMAARAVLMQVIDAPLSAREYRFHVMLGTFGHTLTAAVYLWAAFSQKQRFWRNLLAATSIIELSYCLMIWLGASSIIWYHCLSAVTLVVSALYVWRSIHESRKGLSRDWVHQIGIYCLFSFAALSSLAYLLRHLGS